jgi:hypothetical protein
VGKHPAVREMARHREDRVGEARGRFIAGILG